MPTADDICHHVIQRVEHFSGSKHPVELESYLDRDLCMDPADFVELCEDLEQLYSINLRPFFEDGIPMRRWWIFWQHPVARDVSVKELVDHLHGLVSAD